MSLPNAQTLAAALVGRSVRTYLWREARIVRIDDGVVVLSGDRAVEGGRVPLADIQAGLDQLDAEGEVALTIDGLGPWAKYVAAILVEVEGAVAVAAVGERAVAAACSPVGLVAGAAVAGVERVEAGAPCEVGVAAVAVAVESVVRGAGEEAGVARVAAQAVAARATAGAAPSWSLLTGRSGCPCSEAREMSVFRRGPTVAQGLLAAMEAGASAAPSAHGR